MQRFSNVHIRSAGGGSKDLAGKENIPKVSAEYFEVWNIAPFVPPPYGLYARNVKGLYLQNVRFELENPDARPALQLENVQGTSFNSLQIAGPNG